jgi:hypothetical protein
LEDNIPKAFLGGTFCRSSRAFFFSKFLLSFTVTSVKVSEASLEGIDISKVKVRCGRDFRLVGSVLTWPSLSNAQMRISIRASRDRTSTFDHF